jgi:DNA-binding IclR family transcriptional regulator
VARGWLDRDRATRRYRLGPRVVALGGLALSQNELIGVAAPHMIALRDSSEETIQLSLRADDRHHFTIYKIESPHPIRMTAMLGQRRPLHLGCSGKSILAFRPVAEQSRLLPSGRTFTLASGATRHSADIKDDLSRIRTRGYAESVEEVTPGAAGIGVPILGAEGFAVASLYLSGPTARFTADRRARCARALLDAGRAISAQLGFRGLPPAAGADRRRRERPPAIGQLVKPR